MLAPPDVRYVRVRDGRCSWPSRASTCGRSNRSSATNMRTAQGYVHVDEAMVRDAAERMGGALWGD